MPSNQLHGAAGRCQSVLWWLAFPPRRVLPLRWSRHWRSLDHGHKVRHPECAVTVTWQAVELRARVQRELAAKENPNTLS